MARLQRLLMNLGEGWFQLHRRFPAGLLDEIAAAVAEGERTHRGEVRLVVESRLSPLALFAGLDAPTRARQLFGQLGIWDTEHNNGVLIYVLLAERAIELVADRGVARFVDAAVWRDTVARLGVALREDRFEDGLTQALQEVSAVLVAHFPASGEAPGEAVNQLPDEPVLR